MTTPLSPKEGAETITEKFELRGYRTAVAAELVASSRRFVVRLSWSWPHPPTCCGSARTATRP